MELYPRLVSLPLYPAMTEQEVRYVAQSVRQIVAEYRKLKASFNPDWESLRPVPTVNE